MIGAALVAGAATVFWTAAILMVRDLREGGDPR